MGIGLNSLQYGVPYLGSHYNTGPYIHFPHFGNSNLGKLPYDHDDTIYITGKVPGSLGGSLCNANEEVYLDPPLK